MDWTFLLPWADALRRVVAYDARDEIAYATLHDRIDFVRVELVALDALDALAVVQSHDARLQQLTSLREALELVALVIHYDKAAWRFFHDLCWAERLGSTFPLDESHPDVQANWQLSFCNVGSGTGDSQMALDSGMEMLTRMPVAILSDEYCAAKAQIQVLVGEAWDDSYRVPLSLWFKAPLGGQAQDVAPWLSVVYELVRSLRDSSGIAGECFCPGSVSLSLENAPVMNFTDELLLNLLDTDVAVPRLSINLTGSDISSLAPVMNNAVTIPPLGEQADTVAFVDELVLYGTTGIPHFAGWCSSIERATTLYHLTLRECFKGMTSYNRAIQWMWLAYVVSNCHWKSSVRNLCIYDEELSQQDAKTFASRRRGELIYHPPLSVQHCTANAAQLAPQSAIQLPDGTKETLDDLGWTEKDEFLIVSDGNDDGTVSLLIPGYGRCIVDCGTIVNARELTDAPLHSSVTSLNLKLTKSDPASLLTFASSLGSSLTRINIYLVEGISLTPSQLEALVTNCPVLRFLGLSRVHMVSMDTIIHLYRSKLCHLTTLSLWNVRVSNASLTRFALILADETAYINRCLKEFRYIFNEGKTRIPNKSAISGFLAMLPKNKYLTFLEIGVNSAIFEEFRLKFLDFDGKLLEPIFSRPEKMAFLHATTEEHDLYPDAKDKPRLYKKMHWWLPAQVRPQIVANIWSFISKRPQRRVVNPTKVY